MSRVKPLLYDNSYAECTEENSSNWFNQAALRLCLDSNTKTNVSKVLVFYIMFRRSVQFVSKTDFK